MQSPNGELPTGGRSAQHQWNEAQQCVSYEIWAVSSGERERGREWEREGGREGEREREIE